VDTATDPPQNVRVPPRRTPNPARKQLSLFPPSEQLAVAIGVLLSRDWSTGRFWCDGANRRPASRTTTERRALLSSSEPTRLGASRKTRPVACLGDGGYTDASAISQTVVLRHLSLSAARSPAGRSQPVPAITVSRRSPSDGSETSSTWRWSPGARSKRPRRPSLVQPGCFGLWPVHSLRRTADRPRRGTSRA